MECVVIEFFKVMSTVLHTPLVIILLTIICILYAHFVSPNGYYSVFLNAKFVCSSGLSLFIASLFF